MEVGHPDESAQHFRLGKNSDKLFLCSGRGSNLWSSVLELDALPIEPLFHPNVMGLFVSVCLYSTAIVGCFTPCFKTICLQRLCLLGCVGVVEKCWSDGKVSECWSDGKVSECVGVMEKCQSVLE